MATVNIVLYDVENARAGGTIRNVYRSVFYPIVPRVGDCVTLPIPEGDKNSGLAFKVVDVELEAGSSSIYITVEPKG